MDRLGITIVHKCQRRVQVGIASEEGSALLDTVISAARIRLGLACGDNGFGAGPLRGGTKRPLIAQYSGATLATCATCSTLDHSDLAAMKLAG
jgi:hypothetical protein